MSKVSAPLKLAHVLYRTRRFEAMLAWYQTVFNAHVQHQNPALAFLTYDDEHHRFAFLNLDAVMPAAADASAEAGPSRSGLVGVDHVGYSHASLDDLFNNYTALKSQGIAPYWCIHHGLTVSMYYADPDGNQMEFQVDVFPSSAQCSAFINGPLCAENPIGVEFDPEDWLAQVRAGAKLSDFLTRRVHQPMSPIRGSLAQETVAT